MKYDDIFEHFKRKKAIDLNTKKPKALFFQLATDEHGAFIAVVDQKGKPTEVNYMSYSGVVRNVLRTIEQIQEQNQFVINWERSSDVIYLNEHEHLLWQLRLCDNVIGKDGSPIRFQDGLGNIQLIIKAESYTTAEPKTEAQEGVSKKLAPSNSTITQVVERYSSNLVIVHNEDRYENFQLLTESFALVKNQLFEIAPVGTHFKQLSHFSSNFHVADAQQFLSLFFSYVSNVPLIFEGYQVKQSDYTIKPNPALVFKKIDQEGALHMQVSQVLPNTEIDFLDQFELQRFAEINDLENVINVKIIEQDPIEIHFSYIDKLLQKHTPKKGRKLLSDSAVLDDDTFIIPETVAKEFIHNELPQLLGSYKIFGAEKLKDYKVSTKQPGLKLNLDHGIDFLEGDVTLMFEDNVMSLFEAINQYKKNNYILLNDGTHAIVNEDYMEKLERLFNKKRNKVRVSFFDLPLVEELIEEKVAHEQFRKSRSFFEGFNDLGSKKTKLPKINATLRPYQKQGFKWMKYLGESKLGGCLADDMGLGKTLQTITILASSYPKEKKPSLVVMPRTLLFNWKSEIERFAPQLTQYTYYAKNRNIEDACSNNVILTTYAMVRNDIEKFKEVEFHYVVLDESQNIKNISTQVSRAVILLQAEQRLALSGTPIQNNLGELYSLFRFLNPTMFGSAKNFNNKYGIPIQRDNDPIAIHELRKKIYPFVLRRLKKEVLTELPDKIEQTLYVEMSEKQAAFYEQRRSFYQQAVYSQIKEKGIKQSQFFIFQALNDLRQLASIPEAKTDGRIRSTKLEMLVEQLADAIANGHKVLIFANYLKAVELIGERLDELGIDFVSMTGSTKDRQRLVQRFQNDTECKAFVMTLKTGGTGLNLTAADMIFIFDPWWNKSAENQAIDRAYRIGQTKKVMSYKMITRGSIEEKILLLQEKKSDLFDSIISTDSASTKSLSEDDIQFILK